MPDSTQMTLGDFIRALSNCSKDEDGKDKHLSFDFACMAPMSFRSYRGDYAQLALGYSDDSLPTVAQVLAAARAAIGQTFEGYKGGEFTMNESTPLWAANWGNTGGQQIVGVREDPCYAWIITRQEDL